MKPRALDLFCGAGGVTKGLQRAGFHVTGVDIKRQPRYCGDAFVQADALHPPFRLESFDFIWASPVCKAFTRVWRGQPEKRANYPNQIPATRSLLSSHPLTCIENVPEAPLRPDVMLTGAQFGLPIVRNRIFELNGFTVDFQLVPQHVGTVTNGDLACVAGNGVNNAYSLRRAHGLCKWSELPPPLRDRLSKRNSLDGWRDAMGIDWMTKAELAQAIPPAYSEFIGRWALKHLGLEAGATHLKAAE